jgi:hypothetical protein
MSRVAIFFVDNPEVVFKNKDGQESDTCWSSLDCGFLVRFRGG